MSRTTQTPAGKHLINGTRLGRTRQRDCIAVWWNGLHVLASAAKVRLSANSQMFLKISTICRVRSIEDIIEVFGFDTTIGRNKIVGLPGPCKEDRIIKPSYLFSDTTQDRKATGR